MAIFYFLNTYWLGNCSTYIICDPTGSSTHQQPQRIVMRMCTNVEGTQTYLLRMRMTIRLGLKCHLEHTLYHYNFLLLQFHKLLFLIKNVYHNQIFFVYDHV